MNYFIQKSYSGPPLADILLTRTEDSEDEDDVPFDESAMEDSRDDVSFPFDETPSIPRIETFKDVHYCNSKTCSVCRHPRYPVFVPSRRPKLSRPFAHTRWWETPNPSIWMKATLDWFRSDTGEDSLVKLLVETSADIMGAAVTLCQSPESNCRG